MMLKMRAESSKKTVVFRQQFFGFWQPVEVGQTSSPVQRHNSFLTDVPPGWGRQFLQQ